MRRDGALWLVLICTMGLSACGVNEQASPRIEAKAQQIVDHLRKARLEDVTGEFHYPPGISPSERKLEQRQLMTGLRVALNAFGSIGRSALVRGDVQFVEIGFSAGDVDYWSNRRDDVTPRAVTFQVRFEKVGPGYVQVRFLPSHSDWRVRSIHFGLEARAAGARQFLSDVAKRAMEEALGSSSDGV